VCVCLCVYVCVCVFVRMHLSLMIFCVRLHFNVHVVVEQANMLKNNQLACRTTQKQQRKINVHRANSTKMFAHQRKLH